MTYPIFPTIGDRRLSRRDRSPARQQVADTATEAAAFDSTSATIAEVKRHVNENPGARAAVLEAEEARGDEARSTLIEWLNRDGE